MCTVRISKFRNRKHTNAACARNFYNGFDGINIELILLKSYAQQEGKEQMLIKTDVTARRTIYYAFLVVGKKRVQVQKRFNAFSRCTIHRAIILTVVYKNRYVKKLGDFSIEYDFSKHLNIK